MREVERRLEFFSGPHAREWRPPGGTALDIAAPAGAPSGHQEHVRLMLDLIFLVFQTDSTRIDTFMFANDVSGKNFANLVSDANASHHEFSHYQNTKENYEPCSRINRRHSAQLAYLMVMERMRSLREGERTLLDNSMLFFDFSMPDGNGHDLNNLPVILAGRAGERIDTGRHIASLGRPPSFCNLHVSILTACMGTPVEAFGDDNGALELARRGSTQVCASRHLPPCCFLNSVVSIPANPQFSGSISSMTMWVCSGRLPRTRWRVSVISATICAFCSAVTPSLVMRTFT